MRGMGEPLQPHKRARCTRVVRQQEIDCIDTLNPQFKNSRGRGYKLDAVPRIHFEEDSTL